MKTRRSVTVTLPPAVADQVDFAARAARRSRSGYIRGAVETYMALRRLPEETPTTGELRAIQRGRFAFRRGDYAPLDSVRKQSHVGRPTRRTRAKVSSTQSRN